MYFKDMNFEVKNVEFVNAPEDWFGPCGMTKENTTFFKVEAEIEGVNVRTILPIDNKIIEDADFFDMENIRESIFNLLKNSGRFDHRGWETIE